MKILIVDDERSVRRSLAAFLEDEGHQITEASDGAEALAMIQHEAPDLLLLDLRMPRTDGMGVLRRLGEKLADFPVVVVSGAGGIADAVEAMRLGAWDYLTKPLDDLSLLLVAIDKVRSRMEMRSELRRYQEQLEELVRQRTDQLQAANAALENKAIALREVLDTVQSQKRELVQALRQQLEQELMPLLRHAAEAQPAAPRGVLDQVQRLIASLGQTQTDSLNPVAAGLTATELRICRMLRQGMASKEIASSEGTSPDTVETHRKNIRRKLNIRNEKVNLTVYLQSLENLD